MLCCGNCIESDFLSKEIKYKSSDIGNCTLCPSQNVDLISPDKLSDYFLPVLYLYEKSDSGGENLIDLLRDDWELFLGKSNAFGAKLLRLIIGDPEYSVDGFEIRLARERSLSDVWDEFRRELKHTNRFFPKSFPKEKKMKKLLSFLSVDADRELELLYRARINDGAELFPLDHMGSPPEEKATAGRANPFGISYLYTASTKDTAVAELRPHMDDYITVAHFNWTTSLNLADLRSPKQTISPFQYFDADLDMIHSNIGLLVRLGEELSKPVTKGSEHLEYLPSQYLCEFIKSMEFDGVIYKSSLGDGDNYAIFESDLLQSVKAVGYQVGSIKIECSENGQVIEVEPILPDHSDILSGVVKWFNDSKGFGFITCESLGCDVFVHHSSIRSDQSRKALNENDAVKFKVEQKDKGPSAIEVELVS